MNLIYVSSCVLLITCGVIADVHPVQPVQKDIFQECLDKDSISCIQMTVFRKAKSFFDNPKIELVGGLSLDKTPEARQGKSIQDNEIAVETARSVEARNGVIETYFWDKIYGFLQERSLNLNFADAARSISSSLPDDVKADIRELVVEGRLRKRKILRKLMPVLMALGAKFALLKVASLFGILFIAKKALVISLIALAMAVMAGMGSGLGGLAGRSPLGGASGGSSGGILSSLGGLFGGGGSGASTAAVTTGGHGGGGWSTGSGGVGGGGGGWASSGSGWEPQGAYSAHNVAYAAYKPSTRR